MLQIDQEDELDFGPLPDTVNTLLQRGVAAHFQHPDEAETLFQRAVELAPHAMPAHRCLFKHYNRRRQFDLAHQTVLVWLQRAAELTDLPSDWRAWTEACGQQAARGQRSLALPALKALAFIQLRREVVSESLEALAALRTLDPDDGVGWSVVTALLPEEALEA